VLRAGRFDDGRDCFGRLVVGGFSIAQFDVGRDGTAEVVAGNGEVFGEVCLLGLRIARLGRV
jgi:hypothetical protein